MSGGYFDYKNYIIGEIASAIEERLRKGGKPIPFDVLDNWDKRDWEREHETERKYIECTKENYEKDPNTYRPVGEEEQTILKYKASHVVMTMADIIAHRVDYYESNDDGEDDFNRRLDKDINKAETYISNEDLKEIFDTIIEKVKNNEKAQS